MRIASDISVHPSEKQLAKMPDLTDMRFGRLVAKEYVGGSSWRCACDCGNDTIVRYKPLLDGKRVSCGCYQSELLARPRVDRTGKKYGRLTALYHVSGSKWMCECECGNRLVVDGRNLTTGNTISCGCYKRDLNSARMSTHGKSKERLYKIWKGIIKRCESVTEPAYKNYGGRGITICSEWRNDYEAFRSWAMANGYDPDAPHGECTIDRIDVNGNYEPSNCRFITMAEQARNTRRSRKVEIIDPDGNVLSSYGTIAEAVERTGISESSIRRACDGRQASTHGLLMRFGDSNTCDSEGGATTSGSLSHAHSTSASHGPTI